MVSGSLGLSRANCFGQSGSPQSREALRWSGGAALFSVGVWLPSCVWPQPAFSGFRSVCGATSSGRRVPWGDEETFLAGGFSRPESPPWVWEAGVVVAPAWLCWSLEVWCGCGLSCLHLDALTSESFSAVFVARRFPPWTPLMIKGDWLRDSERKASRGREKGMS